MYGVEVPNHDGRAGCAALLLDPLVNVNVDLDGLLKYVHFFQRWFDAAKLIFIRHARRDLPQYAVPLFLRLVSTAALNSNGLKQDKVQPRLEGVDPGKVQGDRLFVLRGDHYVPFTPSDWTNLSTSKARL